MSKFLTICPICRNVIERDVLSGPLGVEEEHILVYIVTTPKVLNMAIPV